MISKRKRCKLTEEEFPMGPMIDMVFLLLVFFMTVGTLARDVRPPLELAESQTAAVAAEQQNVREIITLLHNEDGELQCYHGARALSTESLRQVIQDVGSRPQQAEWELRIAAELPYCISHTWMQLLGESGVSQLYFSVFRE